MGDGVTTPVSPTIAADEDHVASGSLSTADEAAAGLTYALVNGPAEGILSIDAEGTYTFNPLGIFDDLEDGETRIVGFTYAVDARGDRDNDHRHGRGARAPRQFVTEATCISIDPLRVNQSCPPSAGENTFAPPDAIWWKSAVAELSRSR